MLTASSSNVSYYPTQRLSGGVCRGSMYLDNNRLVFGELTGSFLRIYDSYTSWKRNEVPWQIWEQVGNAACDKDRCSFRLVTRHSTTVYCTMASSQERNLWLNALQTALERFLATEDKITRRETKAQPVHHASSKGPFLWGNSNSGNRNCVVCQKRKADTIAVPFGYEKRQSVCSDCAIAEGLLWHMISYHGMQLAFQEEIGLIAETRDMVATNNSYLQTEEFTLKARQCPSLQELTMSGNDDKQNNALEVLDDLVGISEAAELKKQAFVVAAADMGTALQLLQEQALSVDTSNNTVLQAVLDFLLDLCEQGELSSVAFFWPQICHLHLRMIPAVTALQQRRCELMQDFLLTVATRYSIHLALELVWSHLADLEQTLGFDLPSSNTSNSGDTAAEASNSETTVSWHGRRRRFAVLQFLCEFESLLFDFEGGWGGGSVSLGKLLCPRGETIELLKDVANRIQKQRFMSNETKLNHSERWERLDRTSQSLSQQADEKLRIAKNADYFSCHLAFSKRLADIAEKLRFMDLADRASFLEQELTLLNSSGTMGGDPLNRIRNHLVRVVRVPATEGHVFRSKERTPVLLLIEVIDEMMIEEMDKAQPLEKFGEFDTANHDSETTATTSIEKILLAKEVDNTSEGNVSQTIQEEPCPQLLPPSDDAYLNGSKYSPGPKALKRFEHGSDSPSTQKTPKHEIQQIVGEVAEEQLRELVIPDFRDEDVKKLTDCVNDSSLKDGSPSEKAATTNERYGSFGKRFSSFGSLMSSGAATSGDLGNNNNTLAPTGDVRRAVLTTIMMRGLQGNAIAAGTSVSLQLSLQDLERKRATELLLSDDDEDIDTDRDSSADGTNEIENTRQKMEALGLSRSLDEVEWASRPTEEDECLEAIRLMLIQNRVATGHLSAADASKVLQHTSMRPLNRTSAERPLADEAGILDLSDHPTIDAGDVDSRLVGCGPLPQAVLQALTLWKGGLVSHAELLELVKKDIEFVKHSVLVDADSVDKLKENSAFWGRFAFGERWAEKKSRIGNASPEGSVPGWDLMGVIVKSNDDLRQEAFVMQLIELSEEAFQLAGLELWVSPYRILATGRSTGIIECVQNAMSFDALKKRPGYGKGGLREHLHRMTEFTADPGSAFKVAQQNFVRSLASYSLISYFFLLKDRHNGNLLLDTAGHVIHIDFGFVFGIAPGGSFSLEMSTPFKLTEEMLDVMGGLRSPLFSEFVTLFCCGFLAMQQHCDTFLTIVEITSKESTFKCFHGRDTDEAVAKLRERFVPDLNKEDTVSFALDLIKQATTSYGTRQYDLYQYISQGIVA